MAQRTVIADWIENDTRCLAVVFVENGENVEYIGRVPVADTIGKTRTEIRDMLTDDIKRQRNKPIAKPIPDTDKITGTVNI